MARNPLPAFAGYGIELEYMIVDRASLAIRPLAADLLHLLAGEPASSVERGRYGWSNELVSHVVELKCVEPSPTLNALPAPFQAQIGEVNGKLGTLSARLMPGGMHPFMDPARETALWCRDNAAVYEAYDRIFDCHRHGWANLQSMHINLPFADDAQFARLHAAIRLVLPLIPALAASSPVADGQCQPALDYRLEVYRSNSNRCPAITGDVIPETVRSRAEYQQRVFAPMYREIAPLDPQRRLQHEWLNSRGAIARFDRNAIEIRLADTQECPRADLAVAAAIVAAVKALYEERWCALVEQQAMTTPALAAILRACIVDAEDAFIDDSVFLRLLGAKAIPQRAGTLWAHLIEACNQPLVGTQAWTDAPLQMIVERGTLARRIVRAIGDTCSLMRIGEVYRRLCECLAQGILFAGL